MTKSGATCNLVPAGTVLCSSNTLFGLFIFREILFKYDGKGRISLFTFSRSVSIINCISIYKGKSGK